MIYKAKDITKIELDEIDWKELWADGYDAILIDGVAFSFSRFGLEDQIDKALVVSSESRESQS